MATCFRAWTGEDHSTPPLFCAVRRGEPAVVSVVPVVAADILVDLVVAVVVAVVCVVGAPLHGAADTDRRCIVVYFALLHTHRRRNR